MCSQHEKLQIIYYWNCAETEDQTIEKIRKAKSMSRVYHICSSL